LTQQNRSLHLSTLLKVTIQLHPSLCSPCPQPTLYDEANFTDLFQALDADNHLLPIYLIITTALQKKAMLFLAEWR